MNKRDFMSKLSAVIINHNLDRNDITIVGSCASVLNGLRNYVNDIDVMVGQKNFKILLDVEEATGEHLAPVGHLGETPCLTLKDVSFLDIKAFGNYPTFDHRKYKVLNKLGLLMFRIDLGRDKDIDEIKQLKDQWVYLNKEYTDKLNQLRKGKF